MKKLNFEPMEMTFTIEDADLDKLNDALKDINVRECPWFEVQDKHGNKAKYYREPRWIPNTKETVPKDPLRKQIQLKNGWIITGWFDGEDWFPVSEVWGVLLFDNVEAWRELPSPYNPESEE